MELSERLMKTMAFLSRNWKYLPAQSPPPALAHSLVVVVGGPHISGL